MKTPNSLEEIMRSWTPRKPSRQIHERLFGQADQERAVESRACRIYVPWYQTLGASLAGCTVVLLTALNFTHLAATQHISKPFGTLSNHMTSLAMGTAPVNSWSAPILGWTNEGSSGSSIRSFDLLTTNRSLR